MEFDTFAKFKLGQIVHHHELNRQCVIIDVDPFFLGDCRTASMVVGEGEPLDLPWYHVLVDGREHVSYVSENSIQANTSGEPVGHPSVDLFFREFQGDHYIPRRALN